jgi:hypothetical protein
VQAGDCEERVWGVASILVLAVVGVVVYGVLHDQVTARVCIEYFTIGHPPLPRIFGATESPTVLGIGWGIVATWWMGVFVGLPLAVCARVGGLRKLWARDLVMPVVMTLMVLFCVAMAAGAIGFLAAKAGMVSLTGRLADRVPEERQVYFLADLWAHLTSYGFGALFGLGLCVWVLRERMRRSVVERRSDRGEERNGGFR